jgi:S-DNA-T family DNA segregation ATPase FtsK/SpoIIIE
MTDRPATARRGLDVVALTLGALGVLLAFSLFSATGTSRLSQSTAAAQLGFRLIAALGLAAYVLVAAWFILAAMRFGKPTLLRFARLVLGWALVVAGASVLAHHFGSYFDGGLGGGTIGAAGSTALEGVGPPVIGYLLLSIELTVGLTLAAYPVIRAAGRGIVALTHLILGGLESVLNCFAVVFEALGGGLRRAARLIGRRLHPDRYPILLPIDEFAAPEESSAVPSIPIHHHRQAQPEVPEPFLARFLRSEPAPVEVAPPRPYDLPSLDLLDESIPIQIGEQEQRLRDVATQLEKACADFGLTVRVVGIHTGPVITQYEISLDTGLRVSKITSLSDDLALHLKVPSVRIVAPIPGKNTVGIEVPNEHRATVRLKELVTAGAAKLAKARLPLLLGKDSEGRALVYDLAEMPHLLIAGRTGTGKSVCLNSIILSLLLTRRPDECKLIMLDPKQVELAEYGRLPHLMHPVVTDNKKAEAILAWAVDKMEERYEILRRARVRNIAGYNELAYPEILRRVRPVDDDEKQRVPPRMPFIVIVVDEVGDLMMAMKREVEGHIIRLAQKSRAAGIHLILTTQRPTVDVITGLIKSNLPARICFQVADRSNSRVVLDEMGAEKLLGKGDMLFLQPNTSTIVRAQGTYASDDEILRVVGKLEVENPIFDNELMKLQERIEPGKGGMMEAIRKRDELYEEAIEIVVREGRGSVSLLQRALGIGYGRAARLIDYMAEDGIVGNYNGGQARDVLFTIEQWDDMKRSSRSDLAESA